ncbi:MAG: hypothetical protein IPO29_18505 [Anaerolineae bacterium]|nr:hypothetical protein [Anaerolineae bacterium]
MKRWSIALTAGFTAFSLAACGSQAEPTKAPAPAATQPPAAAATQRPAATSAPVATAAPRPTEALKATEAPAGGAPIDLNDLEQNLEKLKSYRLAWSMTWEGKDDKGAAQTGSMSWLQEYVTASRDQHFCMNTATTEKPNGEAFEWFQVGDAFYIYAPEKTGAEKCFGMTGSNTQNNSTPFKPSDILGGTRNAKLVKRGDTVNGVVTDQYAIDEKNVALGASATVVGNVWVARDGGYAVKYATTAKGASLGLFGAIKGDGTLTIAYDLTDINKINAITIPADCPKPGSGLPVPPGATEKTSIGAMTTFKVKDATKVVADFYKKELAALGYKSGDENSFGDMMTVSFSKADSDVSLMITREGDTTNVIVTETKK